MVSAKQLIVLNTELLSAAELGICSQSACAIRICSEADQKHFRSSSGKKAIKSVFLPKDQIVRCIYCRVGYLMVKKKTTTKKKNIEIQSGFELGSFESKLDGLTN